MEYEFGHGQWGSNLAGGIVLDAGGGSLLVRWQRVPASTVGWAVMGGHGFQLEVEWVRFNWVSVVRIG